MKNKSTNKPTQNPKVDPVIEYGNAMKGWIKEKIEEITSYLIMDFASIKIKAREKDDRGVIFQATFLKPYRQLMIQFSPVSVEMFRNGEFDELYQGLIHELCHMHTIPLSEMSKWRFITEGEINDTAEELTEVIAKYVNRIIDMSKKSGEEYPYKKDIIIR